MNCLKKFILPYSTCYQTTLMHNMKKDSMENIMLQNPIVVVLDTNVCLDLFVFHDPRWLALINALQKGNLRAVTNPGCRDEWLAVLQYKHLPISDDNRPAIINAFDNLIHFTNTETSTNIRLPVIRLPVCSDPDDQQFMELARDCKANYLITKDKALLKCAKKVMNLRLFEILTPENFIKNVKF